MSQPLTLVVLARPVLDASLPLPAWSPGESPRWEQADWILNPFDEVAVEAAVGLVRERQARGLTSRLLVVGRDDAPGVAALDRALALGGDEGVLLGNWPAVEAGSQALATVLAPALATWQPDLLLLGRLAYGQEHGELAPLLAGLLDRPLVMAASQLDWTADLALHFAQHRPTRHHQGQVELPAVVSCELDLASPRYVSLPTLVAARRKPRHRQTLAEATPWPDCLGWHQPAAGSHQVQRLTTLAELTALLTQGQPQEAAR